MNERARRDPFLEHAREEAEGTELLERPDRNALLEREREEAEGVELFENPDATLPRAALKEGAPGEELLTGDSVGLGPDDDEDREGATDESW